MARILVVDDEARIVHLVSEALSGEGYEVDSASDGERAVELVRRHPYELVILDLMLPEVDGISALRRIMATRESQQVLVLSALGTVEFKVNALEIGAADYLPKPFDLDELIARVRARIRQAAPSAPQQSIRAGGVTLDTRRREADAGSGPIRLTERESLLLQYLMAHAGSTCTREQLLTHVWGYSFDPGTNVADVYVGRLRSKLGSRLIETVRNVGYRFAS